MSDLDYSIFSDHFRTAIEATIADQKQFGTDSSIWSDNEMRVVGIGRNDSLYFTATIKHIYEEQITGDLNALMAALEIALSVGVHLERARWEEFERLRQEGQPRESG